ncbi:MAG: VCBS repeat-containing protein [candidate division WOR-3 bacterium]|nr:MAG: VCBS repeat-containing protein [candidate division WOR-3 bacterium]
MNPVVYDLDGDGLKDLMIGNDDGRVYFYKNVGSAGNPSFNATFDTLKTESGTPIDVVAGSRLHFVDWGGDGDLDLLIGGYEGNVQLCENASGTGIQEGEQEITKITGPVVSPNPITGTAQFAFSLETPANVRIDVYSVDGRLVSTPTNGYRPSGEHRFSWNATDSRGRKLPAGIYLARLTTDSEIRTTSLVITR